MTPLNREGVERALKACDLFRGNYEYPPGYEDTLRSAQTILGDLQARQLTANASYEGEKSVVVETISVPAV